MACYASGHRVHISPSLTAVHAYPSEYGRIGTMGKQPFISFQFEKLGEVSWPVVIGFLAAVAAFTSVVNLIVFPANPFVPAAEATAGLVQSTLIVGLVGFVVIVGGMFILAGGLKGTDVGLRWRLVPQALLVTFGLWVAVQIVGLIIRHASGAGVALDSIWQEESWTIVLGSLIAQIFGNALLEETEYRGFLVPQLFLKLKSLWFAERRNYRIAMALVISQVIFALSHIPNRLFLGVPVSEWPLDLFTLVGIGVLYAFIYIRTGNLFVAVGIHSLANVPASLFVSQGMASNVVLLAGLLLVFVWRPSWKKSVDNGP
jgi:membrane protease YdiL (CAAX protease family)